MRHFGFRSSFFVLMRDYFRVCLALCGVAHGARWMRWCLEGKAFIFKRRNMFPVMGQWQLLLSMAVSTRSSSSLVQFSWGPFFSACSDINGMRCRVCKDNAKFQLIRTMVVGTSNYSYCEHLSEQMGIAAEAHNVKILGSGTENIVLAHGFGTDQSVWKHFVPYLVDDYRVILYDNMGAGTTNPDYFDFERHSSLEGYASDLLAILEELQLESCIFVGHSVSAMIGAIASISRPDLFTKLIFIGASPRYLNDVDYYGGFEQEDLNQLFDAMAANYKAWCYGFAPLAVGGDMDSVAVQEFSRTLFNMRPDIALIVSRTIFQSDMRQILNYVSVPCHIIQAEKDMAVPVMISEYLHQHLSAESIVEVMATDGHLPQLSSPDIVMPVLLKHIHLDIEARR
ncbi:hypothetical protein VNO78_08113 [Psophocarpus tetragonolobus]|uniref:AB hydrolase-1 domain-containing protein n=1 Tax=Psophocarpus tetragonolobus TaxID=3891 RepID=A0AAN9SWL8_PSOTE